MEYKGWFISGSSVSGYGITSTKINAFDFFSGEFTQSGFKTIREAKNAIDSK